MIFYFMHYLRVVIIFFSMGLCKSALSGYSLGKIRFLSFFVLFFFVFLYLWFLVFSFSVLCFESSQKTSKDLNNHGI